MISNKIMKLNKKTLHNLIKEELDQLYEADVAKVVEELNNAIESINNVVEGGGLDNYGNQKDALVAASKIIATTSKKIGALDQSPTMAESEELNEIFPLPSPNRDDENKNLEEEEDFDAGPTGLTSEKKTLLQGEELNFEDLSEEELQEMIFGELESLYE